MPLQVGEGLELDARAHEQDGLALLPGHHDLVDRADAVDVRRAVRHEEIAGIDHPQVDVQARPEGLGARGTRTRAPGTGCERPGVTVPGRGLALVSVRGETAHAGLRPRI